MTDGLGQVTDYDYDPAFRMSTMTDPSSQTFHYEYDSAARVTRSGAADSKYIGASDYAPEGDRLASD